MAPKGNKNAVGNHGGRPVEYDPIDIAEKLEAYTDETANPSIAEFLSVRGMPGLTWMNEHEKTCLELSKAIKRQQLKQQAFCLRGERGSFDMFVLKQPIHGYTDKQEIKQDINASVVFLPPDIDKFAK